MQIIGIAVILFVVVGLIIWIANGGLYKDNSGTTTSAGQSPVTTPQPASAPSKASLPTGSSVAEGTNITLDGSNYNLSEITVCISELYMDQYIEALQKKDLLGAYEMVQGRQIFHVPSGTHGLLLEMKPPKAKIRIYGPPDSRKNWKYFGRVGWVLSDLVKAK